MMSWCLLLIYAWSDLTYGTGWGGAYAFNNSLLALWLIVLGNNAYMAKWYILLWCGYDLSMIWFLWLHGWCLDHICGLILRWCIYDAYMVTFIRIRRSINLEYTTSWCVKIPIVLGAHMDEDCWCWWYKEALTNDLELKIHSAGYMDDYSKLHC